MLPVPEQEVIKHISKIYAFIIIVPLIAVLLFKGVFFYEYDTKQRYIKDLVDSTAYVVKITGVLTDEGYLDLKTKLNKFASFTDADIFLKKGTYTDGEISGLTNYNLNTRLEKGDAFLIFVQSSNVSNYSRVQNGGVNPNDIQNLYYRAKAVCRVEYIE